MKTQSSKIKRVALIVAFVVVSLCNILFSRFVTTVVAIAAALSLYVIYLVAGPEMIHRQLRVVLLCLPWFVAGIARLCKDVKAEEGELL